MNRSGKVFFDGILAGRIEETPQGFRLTYDDVYLNAPNSKPISLTLPKRAEAYEAEFLFPFFFGLLAEGILKDTQCRKLKIDPEDSFGRLLKTAHSNTIGAVTVVEEEET